MGLEWERTGIRMRKKGDYTVKKMGLECERMELELWIGTESRWILK